MGVTELVFERLKLKLRVLLAGHIVAKGNFLYKKRFYCNVFTNDWVKQLHYTAIKIVI